MEQLARPGSRLLTHATVREVESYEEVRPLGAMPIRGLPEPVPVFELTGAGTVRTRLQASVARAGAAWAKMQSLAPRRRSWHSTRSR